MPVRAREAAWILMTEEPEPDTDAGFHVADVREGRPAALRETVPVKPLSAVTVTVSRAVVPRRTARVVGDAEREKSAAEVTFRVTLTE